MSRDFSLVRMLWKLAKKIKHSFKKRYLLAIFPAIAAFMVFIVLGYMLRNENEEQIVKLVYEGSFNRGDTIYDLLKNYQVDNLAFLHIKNELKKVRYNPSRVNVGDSYKIVCSSSGYLLSFELKSRDNPFEFIEVVKSTDGVYSANEKKTEIRKNIYGLQGKIRTSLYEAMVEQGLSPEMVMRFVDVFQWEIDFLTEPRIGDSYKMIWERVTTEDGYSADGRILVANYNGAETGSRTGFYFNSESGVSDYYDIKGNSKRRAFLRAPLNYRRISSYYSHRRFHPILRYYRPHLGIDYAAPTGTPVVSIGDGTVEFVGWKGQAGNAVIIKHNSIYKTSYGHLSRFAKGIKRGVKVKQDQLVGYVGTTGLSTGPHLDFRISKYGKFVNFLKLKIPASEGVPAKDMNAFTQEKVRLLRYMAELDQSNDEKDIISLEDVELSCGLN